MKFGDFIQCFNPKLQQIRGKHLVFRGNNENLIKNGAILLEERISLFHGSTNPIHCFSVDDLDSMNVYYDPIVVDGFRKGYAGVWNRKLVMVIVFHNDMFTELGCREVAVATQMSTHSNVHRLLGCCLNTTYPVLVYQWAENGTLEDRIFNYQNQNQEPLVWKERVRIGWEIAHTVAYLHTAFPRPIIHRNVKPHSIFLDQHDSARLSDMSFSISIPEGQKHVSDRVIGTWGYMAPEYVRSSRLAESVDVFSFGALLLELLTGKLSISKSHFDCGWDGLLDLVNDNCFRDIVDPAITANEPVDDGNFQSHLKAYIELAFRCLSKEEEHRPTMVNVAVELKNMTILLSNSL